MRIYISIALLIAFSNINAANITAKLDVSPVLVNDTFHLTYTASGSVDDDPDFSPINNDFDLLGTQQSSKMSMINGNITRSKTWTLTLIAKETGIFTIPAISFGSDQSPKVNVVVKEVPVSNSATPNQDFILELESSKHIGFVQEQVIITARLLIAKNINSYQFSELTTNNSDTLVFPLGKDHQYKTYRGAKQYVVVEKKFALFPQKSETLKINPFIAAVGINNRNSSGRFFDPFNNQTTSKRLRSKALFLEIKPIPSNFKADIWLPSNSVKLIEEWPKNQKFTAGEPITRTLTLHAEGLTAAQLTEITQQTIDGLKQYPDKPETKENKSASGINSLQRQKLALIPTQAGSYTLPAISIPWWNTKTNKIETAYVAKRSFTVLPAISSANIPFTSQKQPIDTSVKANASASPQTESTQSDNKGSFWFGLSILFLVLWLTTLILWWRSKTTLPKKEKVDATTTSLSQSLNQLKTACEKMMLKKLKKHY